MDSILFWLGATTTLSGALLNTCGKKYSFIILNLGNIFNIIGAWYSTQLHLLMLFVGLTLINTFGYFNWKIKKIGT